MLTCMFCGAEKSPNQGNSICKNCHQRGAFLALNSESYYHNGKVYDILPKTLPKNQPELSAKITPQHSEKIWRESDLRQPEPKIVQARKTPKIGLDLNRKIEKFVPPAENFIRYHGTVNQARYIPKKAL